MLCKLICGEIKEMLRYEIWFDTMYKNIRDISIYEIARYMKSGDIQNMVKKKT